MASSHERVEGSQHEYLSIYHILQYDKLCNQSSFVVLSSSSWCDVVHTSMCALENLVIIDIQVVYDSITGVIQKARRLNYECHSTDEKKNRQNG